MRTYIWLTLAINLMMTLGLLVEIARAESKITTKVGYAFFGTVFIAMSVFGAALLISK